MDMPSRNVILFNAGAGALILAGAAALVHSILVPSETQPCTERYYTGTLLGITDAQGLPETPGAMQGRLGTSEWGVADYLAIEPDPAAPQKTILRISLPKGSRSPDRDGEPSGGIGFRWQPGFLEKASSACVSFYVKLPKDFSFHPGGRLPGLYGAAVERGGSDDGAGKRDRFSANFKWNRKGAGAITVQNANTGPDRALTVGNRSFKLERGRWMKLEQELVLNAPGQKDGLLRVWIDGALAVERDDMLFRMSADSAISGVVADTHYFGNAKSPGAPADSFILMTPFELRWQ